MAGGLIQLIIKGPQDFFFTDNPEISFFKKIYKKHTDFTIETKEIFLNSESSFDSISTFKIEKYGDLISNISLHVFLPSLNNKIFNKKNIICTKDIEIDCFCNNCIKKQLEKIYGWTNSIGHVLIESAQLEIDNIIIDTQYGEWLEIWSEMSLSNDKKKGYNEMIGKQENINPKTFSDKLELIIPLNFYFSKNIGLALPIIALYKNDINVKIKWRKFNDCWICNQYNSKPLIIPNFFASLYIDYIYLELEERKRFIEDKNLYLIEQIQLNSENFVNNTLNPSIKLNFKHIVKEIIWIIQRYDINQRSNDDEDLDFSYGNDWFNYTSFKSKNIDKDTFKTAYLSFNEDNISEPLPAIYYRLYQPYQYHNQISCKNIYIKSFSLNPEEYQPSGSCNMSIIDNVKLNIKMNDINKYDFIIKVFGISYNFISIIDGKIKLIFN